MVTCSEGGLSGRAETQQCEQQSSSVYFRVLYVSVCFEVYADPPDGDQPDRD